MNSLPYCLKIHNLGQTYKNLDNSILTTYIPIWSSFLASLQVAVLNAVS